MKKYNYDKKSDSLFIFKSGFDISQLTATDLKRLKLSVAEGGNFAEIPRCLLRGQRNLDNFFIYIKEGEEESSEEIVPGINIELDENGDIIGIEILKASRFSNKLIDSISTTS